MNVENLSAQSALFGNYQITLAIYIIIRGCCTLWFLWISVYYNYGDCIIILKLLQNTINQGRLQKMTIQTTTLPSWWAVLISRSKDRATNIIAESFMSICHFLYVLLYSNC